MANIIETKIKRAIRNRATVVLSSSKSIGSTDFKAVVYVKSLKKYYLVNYTKFSSFMRNVRGASSLAGKTDISNYKEISIELANRIGEDVKARGGSVSRVFFAGAFEKKRGGRIIPSRLRARPELLEKF